MSFWEWLGALILISCIGDYTLEYMRIKTGVKREKRKL